MADRNQNDNTEQNILDAIREANHLDEMGETELAVQRLAPLVKEFPNEPGVRIYLGWYLRRCHRFAEAIEQSRLGVELLPASSRASLVLFQALWDAGNRSEAVNEIRRFLPLRRSSKHTPHYDDILRRWDAGDHGEGSQPQTTKRPIGNA
jgi:predicted Zn-dependent protease